MAGPGLHLSEEWNLSQRNPNTNANGGGNVGGSLETGGEDNDGSRNDVVLFEVLFEAANEIQDNSVNLEVVQEDGGEALNELLEEEEAQNGDEAANRPPDNNNDDDSERTHFKPCQFVIEDKSADVFFIARDKTVQLQIRKTLENQSVFIGIHHSHPRFLEKTIELVENQGPPFNLDRGWIKTVFIPEMNLTMKGYYVHLTNVTLVDMIIKILSSDKRNFGSEKDAREWHLVVIPLSEVIVDEMSNHDQVLNHDPYTLSVDECTYMEKVRIVVSKEPRPDKKRKKSCFAVESEWPISPPAKRRKRKEELYLQQCRKMVRIMTDEQLDAALQ